MAGSEDTPGALAALDDILCAPPVVEDSPAPAATASARRADADVGAVAEIARIRAHPATPDTANAAAASPDAAKPCRTITAPHHRGRFARYETIDRGFPRLAPVMQPAESRSAVLREII
jgi:hypothetical protein